MRLLHEKLDFYQIFLHDGAYEYFIRENCLTFDESTIFTLTALRLTDFQVEIIQPKVPHIEKWCTDYVLRRITYRKNGVNFQN